MTVAGVGNNGNAFGGGGGGAFRTTTSENGGPGAVGQVTISYNVANTPPASGLHYLTTLVSTPLAVPASTQASLDYDANGFPLTVVAVSSTSTNGGTVAFASGTITYTPVGGYVGADQFTYTISDGYGGTAISTNAVTVRPSKALSAFTFVSGTIGGTVNVRGYGVPGTSYDVQRSGTANFSSITVVATVTAATGSGLIVYTDTGAPNPSFYRFAVH